jgi:hypothetical protein
MKKIVFLFLVAILLYGCPPSDCGDMLYETGPPILHIELFDADSEENIFTKELFSSEDLQITDVDGNNIDFRFINENNYNIIQLTPYRYDEENTIFIKLGDEINIELVFDINEYIGECSSTFYIEDIKVENYPYEINNERGILEIKI